MDAYLSVKNGMEECCALFDLAFYLITRNYAVTVADCRLLLRVARGSDPANEAMWSKIAMAAMGRAPKAEAGGSEPVSSPTASPNP